MILKGDCIEVMKALKPNSVHAIVCDPPYGLEFMGKEWDKLRNTWQAEKGRYHNDTTFIAKGDRIRYQAGKEMQLWHTQWLTEAYRVLKPGGSMLVMGGTRTFHRLACAIEDSGFIVKDTLMWMYGSGFPKAQDLGKMIGKGAGAKRIKIGEKGGRYATPKRDFRGGAFHAGAEVKNGMFNDIFAPSTPLAQHWDGFKVGGIKPAYEPIVWAVKPPEGSYVDNVLKWGVGAVNVDECRIGLNGEKPPSGSAKRVYKSNQYTEDKIYGDNKTTPAKGRFPANIILDKEAGKLLDEQSGVSKAAPGGMTKFGGVFGNDGNVKSEAIYSDSGGASRFFYCAKASRSERNEGLEGMEEKRCQISMNKNYVGSDGSLRTKNLSHQNNHPTVKPIALFEWLIRLVTREGQIVLDPFLGSGTTAIAAHNAGRKCVGIEKEDEYLNIAKKRIDYWEEQPKQMELR